MSDFELPISSLKSKASDFSSFAISSCGTIQNLVSSLNSFPSGTLPIISTITSKLNSLSKGLNSASDWENDYTSELETVESHLMETPDSAVFAGSFENMFAKVTIPTITSSGDKKANMITKENKHLHYKHSEYLNPSGLSGSHLNFVNSIKDGAIDAYEKYGVLPSLTLAQAILESGWGASAIGTNIFGIKAGSGWNGKTKRCRTSEQRSDGSYYSIMADFRDYDSISDSIEDHAKLLTTNRYKPVIAANNYKDACVAVRQCGYATSLTYSQKLIDIIQMYGLNQWDPR